MSIIKDNKSLQALCDKLSSEPFITIDTEFLRDKTYYPKLCLIQVAAPEGDPTAIDPLADNLNLAPLFDLLENENVLKVFHAARQDLEIFYNLTGKVPHPIFDTQVAAMVCGFGDSIGYMNLVNSICNVTLDKGAQFTDWSRRPLSDKQLSYALDDVTYLRDVYRQLSNILEKRERSNWAKQEMDILTSPNTYDNPPEQSWKRIKIKSHKPRILAVLREIAAWREIEAQRRDVPRPRVIRDETLAAIAIHPPKSIADLRKIRNMPGDITDNRLGKQLLEAVQRGLDCPNDQCPQPIKKQHMPSDLVPVVEMLKMLLRIQASEHDVAARLIADIKDLETLAQDDNADIPALKGWRYEVFGKDALDMKSGKITLGLSKNKICKTRI